MKNNLEDLASERAVLAALCQYGLDCYLEIDFVDADHFTDDKVCWIRKRILDSGNESIRNLCSKIDNYTVSFTFK